MGIRSEEQRLGRKNRGIRERTTKVRQFSVCSFKSCPQSVPSPAYIGQTRTHTTHARYPRTAITWPQAQSDPRTRELGLHTLVPWRGPQISLADLLPAVADVLTPPFQKSMLVPE
jgi:hypothetical protein